MPYPPIDPPLGVPSKIQLDQIDPLTFTEADAGERLALDPNQDNNLRGQLQAQIDENERLKAQVNAGMSTPSQGQKPAPESDAQKAAQADVDPLRQWGQQVQQ